MARVASPQCRCRPGAGPSAPAGSISTIESKAAGAILLLGIFVAIPGLVSLAAGTVVVLMLGALAMHVKVGDPMRRSVPALLMLVGSGAIVLLA